MALGIEDEGWIGAAFAPDEAALERLVRGAVEAALAGGNIPRDVETELGVTLTGNDEVRALNAEWRGKDKPTNVLSFPLEELEEGEEPGPMLGDLVLARGVVEAEAASEDKAPAHHLVHLLVHGTLHCLGYDHVEAEAAERMEALEIDILKGLGITDPYALPPDDGEGLDPERS
ncbi:MULTISPECIES: rRNA maturation RNase YbeY [unclassified Aureimonas]|uniref:rRNA maturation RNase YbeY n=1 Tax=unclassified Aureimonas TaxID=2615206 RepID=UPI0006F1F6D7|nr:MULTISPECIES: rRNA maturation RNase YbeY [unclassified Aureimonas]KQT64538.1 hypothetical protein ASG62_04845 [Aureimonas sp. Leaf427]KQT81723.1 hypothetical protein ASG54_02110 [Aureimonas sp. Leaf460]